jgi:hAT family C-terminal dimerisation region
MLQLNAIRYPILSRMAMDYLPIQGSSVPCERVFSDAGLTDTKRRARLLPDNFGNIQTVKGKYKKERRCCQVQVAAKRAAERRRWMDDSAQEVQKQKVA